MCELKSEWKGVDSDLAKFVQEKLKRTLRSFSADPDLVESLSNQERDTAHGGYANRQLVELIQNAADQLHDSEGGRIEVILTNNALYCADDGRALDEEGVRALLSSHLSDKRDTEEIGRFGIGFKSVLGISDQPAMFSKSVSIQFDREMAKKRISEIVPNLSNYPVLRIAKPIDPKIEARSDSVLSEFMKWATNIVRLPLMQTSKDNSKDHSKMYDKLQKQIMKFEAEFLLFVPHVKCLEMRFGLDVRGLKLMKNEDGSVELFNGKDKSNWMIFEHIHQLSQEAREDSRASDNAKSVQLKWAAPLDKVHHQHFWAFFPTLTTSLVGGILNAPWKTNEDRQNLLEGRYNDELIDAAAKMICEHLHLLSSKKHPARHLDVLPRRQETGDNYHAEHLRTSLYSQLRDRKIAPNQKGDLIKLSEIRIPPSELTPRQSVHRDVIDLWKSYQHCPPDWLHSDALESNRIALLGRISTGEKVRGDLSRASVSEWMKALIMAGMKHQDEVRASQIAIQTASALRAKDDYEMLKIGNIVFTASEGWLPLDAGKVFLGGGKVEIDAMRVHPKVESDLKTMEALRELGIEDASNESCFRQLLRQFSEGETHICSEDWNQFWKLSRELSEEEAEGIVRECLRPICKVNVKTMHGSWEPIFAVLLLGDIVRIEESAGSKGVVDHDFHKRDLNLLKRLGAVDSPKANFPLPPQLYQNHLDDCRRKFQKQSSGNPNLSYLEFINKSTSGPLEAFLHLHQKARVRLTKALLDLDETYQHWKMRHLTRDYGTQQFPSPAVEMLRYFGCIFVDEKVMKLTDGFGKNPNSIEVQHFLLNHEKSKLIRSSFPELHTEIDEGAEPFGTDEEEALLDVWHGLKHFLEDADSFKLIRCDGFSYPDGRHLQIDAILKSDAIFVRRFENERDELEAIVSKLKLDLSEYEIEKILKRTTTEHVKNAREHVQDQNDDVARILAAVSENVIRGRLPDGLIRMLKKDSESLSPTRIAEAAIALFDTGTLREYKDHITHLDPPQQWAGNPKAVEFVRSLGFSDEWAGLPKDRRAPFIDEIGPCSLPPLHDYQDRAATNIREMLRRVDRGNVNSQISQMTNDENGIRGLLSMPTGSGKTRVAVEAIITAIRDDEFPPNILWIADRDELCEQAVQAWKEAWRSFGPQKGKLRISRLWGNISDAVAADGAHVVVATIQTIKTRIDKGRAEFLTKIALVVVDEAHRSIAPTYTKLLNELGLGRNVKKDRVALLGLTATPYRGISEEETKRLVNRYGNNRLDHGAFQYDGDDAKIRQLQKIGVLARADHEVIEGGRFELTDRELSEMKEKRLPWLPESVEQRIGENEDRTRNIINAYFRFVHDDPECPTLIFATSVRHSEIIAALLSLKGIPSRAVSGKTDRAVRRSVVEKFRKGEVRVLVNYGVFREGFDAPRTGAIIVARPVYSPNLYFQMIGRGLRGPKNGGTDRCKILNVNDNIQNYKRSLAFSELDWLWD